MGVATMGLVLIAFGLILILGQWQWSQKNSQVEELLQRYVGYHNDGNTEGIRSLIYWEGVSDRTRRIFTFAMQEETLFPIKEIRYRPFEEKDREELLSGVSIPIGVTPVWRVWLVLDSEDRFTSSWLVGQTSEGLRFLIGQ